MSKRKKTQASEENQEVKVSKAKKTYKKKPQVARDGDLEKAAEISDSINTPSKANVVEAVQECQIHSRDNTEMAMLATDLDTSSAGESKKPSLERKGHAKSFVPPSQGGRLVPAVAKTKNSFPERCEGTSRDSPANQMKEDVLESSEAECMVRNAPCDAGEKAFQSIAAPSESIELVDLSVTNKENTGNQGIHHCEDTLDVKIQNQDGIISINNGDAIPGCIDSQLEEAQKPNDKPANISEKQKMKSKKRVSFSLCTSDNKDAKNLEERELSTGSLDYIKSDQTEDTPEGPSLQTKQGTKNRCDKLVPLIKQSMSDTCDLRPNEISKTLSKRDADQQMEADQEMAGKEKTVMYGENELVCVEGGLSPAEIIPQLDRVVVRSDSSSRNPGSEAQGSLLSRGEESSSSALNSLDPVEDPLPVDLELMLDSQLQGIFENNTLEHPAHKPFSLDDPCSAKIPKPIVNAAPPNNARNEMTVRICDPSKEEDATDVVCGLIKELSNLNRLVMSTHRDLESFKRLKFQRYKQSGKLLPHSMNTVTNMWCTVRKKKKMSLASASKKCKDFLCSSNVSPAVTSKAIIMPDAKLDV